MVTLGKLKMSRDSLTLVTNEKHQNDCSLPDFMLVQVTIVSGFMQLIFMIAQ